MQETVFSNSLHSDRCGFVGDDEYTHIEISKIITIL